MKIFAESIHSIMLRWTAQIVKLTLRGIMLNGFFQKYLGYIPGTTARLRAWILGFLWEMGCILSHKPDNLMNQRLNGLAFLPHHFGVVAQRSHPVKSMRNLR